MEDLNKISNHRPKRHTVNKKMTIEKKKKRKRDISSSETSEWIPEEDEVQSDEYENSQKHTNFASKASYKKAVYDPCNFQQMMLNHFDIDREYALHPNDKVPSLCYALAPYESQISLHGNALFQPQMACNSIKYEAVTLNDYDMCEISVEWHLPQLPATKDRPPDFVPVRRVFGINAGMTLFNLHRIICLSMGIDNEQRMAIFNHVWILPNNNTYGGGPLTKTRATGNSRLKVTTDRAIEYRHSIICFLDENECVISRPESVLLYVFGCVQLQVQILSVLRNKTKQNALIWVPRCIAKGTYGTAPPSDTNWNSPDDVCRYIPAFNVDVHIINTLFIETRFSKNTSISRRTKMIRADGIDDGVLQCYAESIHEFWRDPGRVRHLSIKVARQSIGGNLRRSICESVKDMPALLNTPSKALSNTLVEPLPLLNNTNNHHIQTTNLLHGQKNDAYSMRNKEKQNENMGVLDQQTDPLGSINLVQFSNPHNYNSQESTLLGDFFSSSLNNIDPQGLKSNFQDLKNMAPSYIHDLQFWPMHLSESNNMNFTNTMHTPSIVSHNPNNHNFAYHFNPYEESIRKSILNNITIDDPMHPDHEYPNDLLHHQDNYLYSQTFTALTNASPLNNMLNAYTSKSIPPSCESIQNALDQGFMRKLGFSDLLDSDLYINHEDDLSATHGEKLSTLVDHHRTNHDHSNTCINTHTNSDNHIHSNHNTSIHSDSNTMGNNTITNTMGNNNNTIADTSSDCNTLENSIPPANSNSTSNTMTNSISHSNTVTNSTTITTNNNTATPLYNSSTRTNNNEILTHSISPKHEDTISDDITPHMEQYCNKAAIHGERSALKSCTA